MENRLVAMIVFVAALSLVPTLGASANGAAENAGAFSGRSAVAASVSSASGSTDLPITRVVLFSSGVGYFERSGMVSGDADVSLVVPRSDVNDLLKSLTVQDATGRVRSVDYPSRDPLDRTLQSFSVNIGDNPSLEEILTRARGAQVRVAGPTSFAGSILSVESRIAPQAAAVDDGAQPAAEPYLNVMTSDGIRSIAISQIKTVQFLDPRLESDLTAALDLIAANRNTNTNRLDVAFSGSGSRPVQLSYVLPTPVWKTSYRLTFDKENGSFIQGWALVDNPTNDDWKNVKMALVSGEPISFQMDLGQPVYSVRPTIEVPLPPTVTPQTYESSTAPQNGEDEGSQGVAAAPSAAPYAAPPSVRSAAAPPMSGAGAASPLDLSKEESGPAVQLNRGVQSAATAGAAGEFFQYVIKDPVTLPRQQSAMVPIVNQSITAKRVAIYNESVLQSHPLSGLQLENSTGLHLMAGPITVFEDGVYAGDAEIGDLTPNTTRLISFAVDLDTDATTSSSTTPDVIFALKITRGTLVTSTRLEREHDYTFVNRSGEARTILVEYPVSADWTLTQPAKPDEQTQELYRFSVTTDPAKGGRAALGVKEERIVSQSVALSNIDSRTILYYMSQQAIPDSVKAALATLTDMKSKLAALQQQRQSVQDDVSSITSDQQRIRGNMNALQASSDLYKRYVDILSAEEDKLAVDRASLDDLSAKINAASQAIAGYLSGLSVP